MNNETSIRSEHHISVRDFHLFTYYAVVFSGLLVIANVLAVKPIVIFGQVVPAAVITYAVTFAITDTVNEIWGARQSAKLVTAGFVVSVIVAIFIRIGIVMPATPDWDGNAAFNATLGSNFRIVTASMIAYLASQFHDVWAFSFWRRITGRRHLWLRNNASTIVSQLIDSALFITISFYGVWGGWDAIVPAIFAQFFVKFFIALADTPVVYALVWWTKRKLHVTERITAES